MSTSNTTNWSTHVSINRATKAIEITKKLDNASKRYDSEAYNFLEEVRAKHPNFRLVVKTSKRKATYKGLTYKYMEEYIKNHGDEEGKIMREFNILRGKAAPEGNNEWDTSVVASYLEVKEWFLRKFSEIDEYRENARKGIQDILNAA